VEQLQKELSLQVIDTEFLTTAFFHKSKKLKAAKENIMLNSLAALVFNIFIAAKVILFF